MSAVTGNGLRSGKGVGAAIVICALAAYPVLFFPAHRIIGGSALALGLAPILAAGAFLGMRQVFYTALCTGLMNVGLGLAAGAESRAIMGDTVYMLAAGVVAGAAAYFFRLTRSEITGRKKAEETVTCLTGIVDRSEFAIVGISADGLIGSWSPGAQKMYGYSTEDVIGRPLSLLMAPECDDETQAVLEVIGRGEYIDDYEAACMRKDGRLIDVSLSVLRTGNCVSVIAREITERKAEDALRMRNAELSALYGISSALNETMNIDISFPKVLQTITDMGIRHIENKGAIFSVEDGGMRLICHLGTNDDFVNLHTGMKVGDCLCGLAAAGGEVIISGNSLKDDRHTMSRRSVMYREMTAHGHVIIPLKAKDRVTGVLCLYLPADVRVDEGVIRMLLAIGNHMGLAIDSARLYAETKELSLLDPLTGLANRRLMEISMEKNFASARRYERPFSVIMLDIDHFKNYNDTYGHSAGDKLLTDIAKMLTQEVRETDLAVRYGGEEFLIMLPETKLGRAYEVAERIRERVQAHGVITISLGVSTYQAGMEQKDDIINMADNALYQAKNRGRNQTIALKQATD